MAGVCVALKWGIDSPSLYTHANARLENIRFTTGTNGSEAEEKTIALLRYLLNGEEGSELLGKI